MPSDNPTIAGKNKRCQGSAWKEECAARARKLWAEKRGPKLAAKRKAIGNKPADQYQHIGDLPYAKDWRLDVATGQVTGYCDYLQPEFLIRKYGGSCIQREAVAVQDGTPNPNFRSLAQDCRVPKRDENGWLIQDEDVEVAA